MPEEEENLVLVRGDTRNITVIITDSDDNREDISTDTFFFTVKSKLEDTDANAVISIDIGTGDHTDPTNGETQLQIAPADTINLSPGRYWWDMQRKTASGDLNTYGPGVVEIKSDVTIRTTV